MRRVRFFFLSILTGLLLALAFPATGNIAPLAFIGLVPLFFIEDHFYRHREGKNSRGLFPYAWLAFLVFNLVTTWWILYATVAGMIMAVVFNSLFMAIVFQLFHFSKRVLGPQRGYFALFFYWVAFEWVHLNWELSWPWLNLGNSFANWIEWVQWYEYTGTLGGTLWILIVNAIVFQMMRNFSLDQEFRKKLIMDVLLLILFVGGPVWGSYGILEKWEDKEEGEPVEITLLQPNIDPYEEKFPGGAGFIPYEKQLDRLIQLAEMGGKGTDLFIGPETALPGGYWEAELKDNKNIRSIREFLGEYPDARFLVGLSSREFYKDSVPPTETAKRMKGGGYYDSYNTALQLDKNGRIQFHHKSKLVLGVEKIPFSDLLGFLEDLALDLGGASGSLGYQKEPSVFTPEDPDQNGSQVAPLICYESVYGEFVADAVRNKGADLLAIMTNDGWWEDTPGYRQHMAYARLRAVETRRDVARAANTGISAFIDRTGKVIQRTEWWVKDSISATMHRNQETTYYTRIGDGIGRLLGFLALLMLPYSIVKWIRHRNDLQIR